MLPKFEFPLRYRRKDVNHKITLRLDKNEHTVCQPWTEKVRRWRNLLVSETYICHMTPDGKATVKKVTDPPNTVDP